METKENRYRAIKDSYKYPGSLQDQYGSASLECLRGFSVPVPIAMIKDLIKHGLYLDRFEKPPLQSGFRSSHISNRRLTHAETSSR